LLTRTSAGHKTPHLKFRFLEGTEQKMPETKTIHNPEFVALAKVVFDEVCAKLPPGRNTQSIRAHLAERILKAAGAGERDPARLCAHALRGLDELA
jgi:hypothetical protein